MGHNPIPPKPMYELPPSMERRIPAQPRPAARFLRRLSLTFVKAYIPAFLILGFFGDWIPATQSAVVIAAFAGVFRATLGWVGDGVAIQPPTVDTTVELERWHKVYNDALYETMDEVEAVRRADAAKPLHPPRDSSNRSTRGRVYLDQGYSNPFVPGRVVKTKVAFDPTVPPEMLTAYDAGKDAFYDVLNHAAVVRHYG